MVNKGKHPQMAQNFRLVKYYNLPRIIINHILTIINHEINAILTMKLTQTYGSVVVTGDL